MEDDDEEADAERRAKARRGKAAAVAVEAMAMGMLRRWGVCSAFASAASGGGVLSVGSDVSFVSAHNKRPVSAVCWLQAGPGRPASLLDPSANTVFVACSELSLFYLFFFRFSIDMVQQ